MSLQGVKATEGNMMLQEVSILEVTTSYNGLQAWGLALPVLNTCIFFFCNFWLKKSETLNNESPWKYLRHICVICLPNTMNFGLDC